MSRYIISDLHMGHKNIHKFRSAQYEDLSAEDHWEMAMEGLRGIKKRATIFLMGDIAFSQEFLDEIKNLPCQNKILLCGNHDLDCSSKVSMKDLVEAYDQVHCLRTYKGFLMSHGPQHPAELRGKRNVHGHAHHRLMLDGEGNPDTNYINVCVEYTGYTPITWEYAISDEYQQECSLIRTNLYPSLG